MIHTLSFQQDAPTCRQQSKTSQASSLGPERIDVADLGQFEGIADDGGDEVDGDDDDDDDDEQWFDCSSSVSVQRPSPSAVVSLAREGGSWRWTGEAAKFSVD